MLTLDGHIGAVAEQVELPGRTRYTIHRRVTERKVRRSRRDGFTTPHPRQPIKTTWRPQRVRDTLNHGSSITDRRSSSNLPNVNMDCNAKKEVGEGSSSLVHGHRVPLQSLDTTLAYFAFLIR